MPDPDHDHWLVRVDARSVWWWDKTVGCEQGRQSGRAVFQTVDGGFFLAQTAECGAAGDKTHEARGGKDFWMVRLSAMTRCLKPVRCSRPAPSCRN